MFRSTIDLFKPNAAEVLTTQSSIGNRQFVVTLQTHAAGARGWYRVKIRSPGGHLQRVGMEVVNTAGLQVCAFEYLTPGEQFAGYAHLSDDIALIRVRVEISGTNSSLVTATLRPITAIEFIWHSNWKTLLQRPDSFARYYVRPPDPFTMSFEFPRPPRFANQSQAYAWWIRKREPDLVRKSLRHAPSAEVPTIAVLLTVCDPQPVYLRAAIDSVRRQTSPNWQLCIADDASVNPEIRQILADAARNDSRITVAFRERRDGISAATNTAFAQCSAPFLLCLDHDDLLAPFAIEIYGAQLAKNPNLRLMYSDEDKIDGEGNRFTPYFKPDFSRELLYSYNYINHLTVYHCDTMRQIGGWRSELDGAQDYDTVLRTLEVIDETQIRHVPLVLYHWRAIVGSTAADVAYKPYAIDAGLRALREHMARRAVPAHVESIQTTIYRIRYELPQPQPKVSIIIPFRDRANLLRNCLASIREKTTYSNYEIVLVDNGSTEPATIELLTEYRHQSDVQILQAPGPFNYSALNNRAVAQARGEYVCLLNNDTEIITPDWLDDMVGYASQPGVGCVGAKLYYANNTLQHAGIVLGIGGVAGHVLLNMGPRDRGYFGRLLVASNYSAVTGACLLVRRSIFQAVGGLDEKDLAIAFNDVDFCLKVRALGYRNVMTPFAELFHFESTSRGREDTVDKLVRFRDEMRIMQARYGAELLNDPCYSPHLTLERDDFSIRVG